MKVPRITISYVLIILCACASPGNNPTLQDHSSNLEGIFPADSFTHGAWQIFSNTPSTDLVQRVATRVGKLVIAQGRKTSSKERADWLFSKYCTPDTAHWNEQTCSALKVRKCDAKNCRYQGFGNCSGFWLDHSRFITAAHCVADLLKTPTLRASSYVVPMSAELKPLKALPLGRIRIGKHDFSHNWVSIDETQPVDVAEISIPRKDVDGVWPTTPLPTQGVPVWIMGFPRLERRSQVALSRRGYALTFATPSISVGYLSDRNDLKLPFCANDENQENWTLTPECPSREIQTKDGPMWLGVILTGGFLATFDTSNGYSGAPVFDFSGNYIGINNTIISRVDPQEQYDPKTRAVVTPIETAIKIFGSEQQQ